MGYVEGRKRTFTTGETFEQFTRVKLSSGKLVKAGENDLELGCAAQPSLAADEPCAVILRNAEGTHQMVAAGSFSAGATIYGAASGKVDDVATSRTIGTALEAATGDGQVVEVLPSS